MIIGGIILIIALLAGTYFVAGDAFSLGEDYINDLTMLGGVAIIVIVVLVSLKYVNQIKNDKATGKIVDGSWDSIKEYDNNLPVGWALSFIGTLIFYFWYILVGYPTNQFSQIGQWNEETLEHQAKFEAKWNDISDTDLKSMGESVYLVQCAPCHGIDAEGIDKKAQNLTARMSKEQVLEVIKNGSKGLNYPIGEMPPGMASVADADVIASWIADGSKGTPPASFEACVSCHGIDARGQNGMAPDLTAYTDTLISKVLTIGKKGKYGTMPSFNGRLTDTQIKAVSTYIKSLGE
jgi:cytochrome c oxidase cbb3-type subunit 3